MDEKVEVLKQAGFVVRKNADGMEDEEPYYMKATIPLLEEKRKIPVHHEVTLKLRNHIRLVRCTF
jgi:hypothetical protein